MEGLTKESAKPYYFENIYKEYEELLKTFYLREEGESLVEKLNTLKGRSSYIYRKHELIQKLNMAGIEADDGMSENELMLCVHKLPKEEDMENSMFEMLYRVYTSFDTPEMHIERIVRTLGDEKYRDCSVRLAILKQFILNTDYHTGPVKEMIRGFIHANTGELLKRTDKDSRILADWADDELFNVLNRKLTKNEKKKYHLLRVCDDLASGRFKTNGNTRKALYMFAFAFDMESFLGAAEEEYNPNTDIEKRLFFDYYGNHMMRYLKSEDSDKISDYESEPTGEGINYKNYVEVIYLYYLNRKDYDIRTRLLKAESLIKECEKAYASVSRRKRNRSKIENTSDYYTYVFKDYYMEIINELREDQLKEFIVEHYVCLGKDLSKSNILISSETVTADYRYRSLMRKRGRDHDARDREIDKIIELNPEWDGGFVRMIHHMDEMLHPATKHSGQKITRTDLIAAFYENCRTSTDQEGMSLLELFIDCEMKLNPILIESRYQPLCLGNLFDIFMVIMLYRYLNII